MPSPRWPTRAMARRSVTGGPEQKFGVAVAARNGRGDDVDNAPAERCYGRGNSVADVAMDCDVAHDAALQRRAPGLELRLDQRDQLRRRARQRQRGGQHQLERNEAYVDSNQVGPCVEASGGEGT